MTATGLGGDTRAAPSPARCREGPGAPQGEVKVPWVLSQPQGPQGLTKRGCPTGCHHTQPPSPNPDLPRAGRTFWAASPQIIAGQQSPSLGCLEPMPLTTSSARAYLAWGSHRGSSGAACLRALVPKFLSLLLRALYLLPAEAPAALPAFPSWQGSST